MTAVPVSTGVDEAARALAEACAAVVAANFRDAGYRAQVVVLAVGDGDGQVARGVFINGITNQRRLV